MMKYRISADREIEERLKQLSEFVNHCEKKINHLDILRQKNIVFSIALFGGLFGFASSVESTTASGLAFIALIVSAYVLNLLDTAYKKYTRSWINKKKTYSQAYAVILSNPELTVRVKNIAESMQSPTKREGYIKFLYYGIIVISSVSFFIFQYD